MNDTKATETEALSTLPAHWAVSTLAEVVALEPNAMTDGPFGSKLKTSHYVESGVRVIRLGNIGVGEFKDEDEAYVSLEYAKVLAKHAVEAGDLLIAALADPVGRCCQVPPQVLPALVKADCIRFKPHPVLTPKFLMHWLNSPQGVTNAEAHSHGVGRLRINMKNMRSLEIPVAPGIEQQRIVEALDSYFSRLDDAIATLERVQRNLKRYRGSVLKAAVEGRLVPTEAELARAEDREYEPASALLERILAERRRRWEEAELAALKAKGKPPKNDKWRAKYKPPVKPDTSELPELPDGWCWATTESLFWDASYGTSQKCTYEADGPPVLRIPNIQRRVITLDDLKFATGAGSLKPEGVLSPSDFLFIRTNGSRSLVGRGAVVTQELPTETFFASYLIRLRVVPIQPVPRWLGLAWHSRFVRDQLLKDAASSAGQHNVSLSAVRKYLIPLPPAHEQERIIEEVERLFSLGDSTASIAQENVDRTGRLRQAILKSAFEGKLADADPMDEPAAALLERLKLEREAAAANGGAKPRKPRVSAKKKTTAAKKKAKKKRART